MTIGLKDFEEYKLINDDDHSLISRAFYVNIQMRFTLRFSGRDFTILLMSTISNPAVYNLLKVQVTEPMPPSKVM